MKPLEPIGYEDGWFSEPIWTRWRRVGPCWESKAGCPARNGQSLYCLSYPGS
jgi:hypothetical protein